MLFREVEGGTLAITQTTHAWVSGQIARAWGNELTGTFAPREAMLLAAEQHDIGWLNREPEPALNADAGRPRSFLELPPETHLSEIWSHAGEMALLTSRYAALLVSLHGTHLYNRFRGDLDAANGLAQPFLEQQDAFQATLIESLGSDPNYAAYVTPKLLRRNRRLIALWDRLSLDICRGMGEPDRIEQVPFARDDVTLTIAPVADEPYRFTLAPWPFSNLRIGLIFEGRVLSTRFTSEASLKRGLAEAPWQSVAITLIPG
ncbi:MAG TPA: DUF3891 family protein [Nitrolancea sp.]|nr:DUF3891 family protein [Nitrolancea sp.]